MKYKCVVADIHEVWLTVGKVYDGEQVVSPKEFSGGNWLLLRKADDGFPCYVKINQFVLEKDLDSLGV